MIIEQPVYFPNVIAGKRPLRVLWHPKWECFVYLYVMRFGTRLNADGADGARMNADGFAI